MIFSHKFLRPSNISLIQIPLSIPQLKHFRHGYSVYYHDDFVVPRTPLNNWTYSVDTPIVDALIKPLYTSNMCHSTTLKGYKHEYCSFPVTSVDSVYFSRGNVTIDPTRNENALRSLATTTAHEFNKTNTEVVRLHESVVDLQINVNLL